MSATTGRFRRTDRILRSADFRQTMGRGERLASGNFVIFVDRNSPRSNRRIGITVSRRVGNSVVRNHIKRRVREWYRSKRDRLPAAAQLVVIARPGARDLTTGAMFEDLDRVVGRLR